ncbi:hypothetical protein [Nocardioides pocheonensis]|uniref:Uncharacterized protein n=1 Tax=Nocardioides pocheonensis TaxID=661485 RepID=A0A3N0GLI6_9ACTN|nr:hypothetical protein [Nocardioides pocheonensis]RNM13271.1 hypothetical protein EFL26_15760 [Nocardioides pocheonensis]
MDADNSLTITRRSLHGVAELLLAGPQHAAHGTIRLRPQPRGFGTTCAPDIRVVGASVIADDRSVAIDGRTARDIGDELGIRPVGLSAVYHDGSGIGPDDVLHGDQASAERIAHAYALGDQALRAFAPDQEPTLWPEHFDLGVTLEDRRVNLGVSPGDGAIAVPYMYVGPWQPPAVDAFWTQPFGAARPLPDSADEIAAFFSEGMDRLRHAPR